MKKWNHDRLRFSQWFPNNNGQEVDRKVPSVRKSFTLSEDLVKDFRTDGQKQCSLEPLFPKNSTMIWISSSFESSLIQLSDRQFSFDVHRQMILFFCNIFMEIECFICEKLNFHWYDSTIIGFFLFQKHVCNLKPNFNRVFSCSIDFQSEPPYRQSYNYYFFRLVGTNSLGTLDEDFTIDNFNIGE